MAIVKKYGIDVSAHQGNINWQTVKAAGVEWVILRAGYGFNTVDSQFLSNIQGAVAAGIEDIGIYWFSYAGTVEHIQTEVASCLSTIAPYRNSITLPVFFDWESASKTYVQNEYGFTPTPAQIRDMATAWCNAVTAAGYTTGIYSNKSDADNWFLFGGQYLWQTLSCEHWYARYGANNETSLFIVPAFEEIAKSEHPEMNIFQYSDVGIISGINSNRVDLNIRYVDSPTPTPEPEPEEDTTQTDNMDYLEVRGSDFTLLGLIDTAKSVIWHSLYYGVGDFEIYIRATDQALNLLQIDRYITRPNNKEVGIIEHIGISDNLQDGMMLTITGRFAKSILDRRHIYKLSGTSNTATILSGNVEAAVRQVVSDNAIDCTDPAREFGIIELGASAGTTHIIVDSSGTAAQKQVSYQNLLSYTDGVLQEYGLSSRIQLKSDESILQYVIFEGKERTYDNTAGNQPIIFSKEYDNLTESAYEYDTASYKNTALIGGVGEDISRFYAMIDPRKTGLARREMWIDASSVNREYKDDQQETQTYTDAEYTALLQTHGLPILAENIIVEAFNGTLDITHGTFIFNRDFSLGDLVTVHNSDIGVYINVRVVGVTEVQDENGYTIEIEYDNK